jgi:hypothetical protein
MLEDQRLTQVQAKAQTKPNNAIDYIHVAARRVIVWSAILGTGASAVIGAYPIFHAYLTNQAWVYGIIQKHFAATVGLPGIAALAFLIVITFEARFEAIEMEFFGIVKFKGASGPIILWVLCVLTMASCVRMLW